MTDFEELLDRDWGALWDDLPDAPDLVPRSKTAQITLRIPRRYLTRLKAVAKSKSLPYHTMARSWLAESIATTDDWPQAGDEYSDAQFNIKMDHELLDSFKRKASQLRRPYHALARDVIVTRVVSEERALRKSGNPASAVRLGELILLLLDAPGRKGSEAIRGMTRLQKLLFVVEQELGTSAHFYAHNYGPFDDAVYDATLALQRAGFVTGDVPIPIGPPTFAYMVTTVQGRSGPSRSPTDVFALTPKGREAVQRLRRSNRAYEALYARVAAVRQEWDVQDLDELIERIYEAWPEYADRSLIRHQVAERARRRRRT